MINFKNSLGGIWSRIESYGRKHSEYVGILVALLLLLVFPPLIRMIDPSAAPIDPGVLSAILLAVVAILIFNSVTWWIIRAIWPVFAEYSNEHFTRNFKTLTPCQKVVIYLAFFFVFILSFVAALVAIL